MAEKTRIAPELIEPPWSENAEISVLGGVLVGRESDVLDARLIVKPDEFFREAHRTIYRAMLELIDEAAPTDIVSVSERLRSSGELDRAGGLEYLAELLDAVPTAASLTHHAKIVVDKARRRKIIDAATRTIREVYDGEETEAVLENAERRFYESGAHLGAEGYLPASDGVAAALASMEEAKGRAGHVVGIPTGLPTLDRLTTGLRPGDLTLLAGRPGHGKTALAWQIVLGATKKGHGVAFASLEMSKEQLFQRGLAGLSGVPLQKIRAGTADAEEVGKIAKAAARLDALPLWVDDNPAATVEGARAKIRQLRLRNPIELLVVDYLQLMAAPGAKNRNEEVSKISRGLKMLARELGVHVLALSQLSRDPEGRSDPEPKLSDLRDSGSLEQDADLVVFVIRPELYFSQKTTQDEWAKWQGKGSAILGKQRNGPTGHFVLRFDAKTTGYAELETRVPGGSEEVERQYSL